MLMLNNSRRLLVTCSRANRESNRAYKWRQHEQNSDEILASKRLKIQANRETNRASHRSIYWRNLYRNTMVWRATFSLEQLEK